jgi:cytochrome c551/c552
MLVVAGLITSGAASTASAAEQRSGCVACHLDEAMLVQNLSATKAKKSALQSGAG